MSFRGVPSNIDVRVKSGQINMPQARMHSKALTHLIHISSPKRVIVSHNTTNYSITVRA